MADPELAVLASDIRALSALLNVADYYWWPAASGFRTVSTGSKSFSHISTLVGLSSSIPVAITGTVAAGEATVTVVCPRTRTRTRTRTRGPKAQQLPDQDVQVVESHSIQGNVRSLKEIFQDAGTPQGLEGYVSDLVALFGMVHSRNISSVMIIQWIIRRSWLILDARMKRSETDFMGDLFILMASWSPDDYDRVPEEVIDMPITSSNVYKKCGVTVDHASGIATSKFSLNKTTASILVKAIAQIFIYVRMTLADADRNVDRSAAARSLVNPFIWLHGILTNRHVEALMTETSLRVQLIPHRLDGAGDEHRDGWEPRPGPNCMRAETHYGLRYLRMLVACVNSVFRLDDPKILPLLAAANVTVVTIVPSLHDTAAECRRVVEAIADEIKQHAPADALWLDAALEWMWERTDAATSGERETCKVHAEAGLMALACEARLSHDNGLGGEERREYGLAFSGFMRTPTGISASGKCCPLCLRLMQFLNAHFASLGDAEALVSSFPETHGKVLPWDPPQFGIPKSVLQQLRDELQQKFVEKAISAGMLRASEADQPGSDEYTYKEDLLAIHGEIDLPDGLEW